MLKRARDSRATHDDAADVGPDHREKNTRIKCHHQVPLLAAG